MEHWVGRICILVCIVLVCFGVCMYVCNYIHARDSNSKGKEVWVHYLIQQNFFSHL